MTRVPYRPNNDRDAAENADTQQQPYGHDAPSEGNPRREICLLVGCGCGGPVLLFVLFLVAVPLITSGRPNAPRYEGEELMNSCHYKARFYASSPAIQFRPSSLTEVGATDEMRTGEHYRVLDRIEHLPDGRAAIFVVPVDDPDRPNGKMIFHWDSGQSEIIWED